MSGAEADGENSSNNGKGKRGKGCARESKPLTRRAICLKRAGGSRLLGDRLADLCQPKSQTL